MRHGETPLAAEDRFAGATDVELSERGRAQAERLAERLAGDPLAAVYTSPLRRTRDTADRIAAPHGLAPRVCDALREIDHGRWETLRRVDVAARYAEEYAAWSADPFGFAPEGGETGAAVLARALPALHAIAAAHPDARVAVVSHKATIRLLACALLGIDPRGYRDLLEQAPACLDVLDLDGPTRAKLVLWNDTSHWAGRA